MHASDGWNARLATVAELTSMAMTPEAIDRITRVVVLAYAQCTPGTGGTFLHMLLIFDALLGPMPDDAAFDICSRVFEKEHAAFARDFEGVFTGRHAGRFQLHFGDPKLN